MNIYCEFENLNEISNKRTNFISKTKLRKLKTTITKVEIKTKKQSLVFKKDKGLYTTIFCEEFDYLSNYDFDFLTSILQKEIEKSLKTILKNKDNENLKYFVVGLGNIDITADSLGPKVVDNILSTYKDIEDKKISNKIFGNVFTLSPSIASKNGIYTYQIIKSICKELKPDVVILIDSLSCKNINYLGRTFQINTCGLTPGGEIENAQPIINKTSLKIPVLAIGCPVVTNLSNLQFSPEFNPVLTLKDIDIAINKYSDIISFSLNKIIHKNLTKNEIIFLTKK